eukprot:scaffold40020_cov34-Attheya_sp.AAC.2
MVRGRRSILSSWRATPQENIAQHMILDQTYEALSLSTNEKYALAHTIAEDSLEIEMSTQDLVSDLTDVLQRKTNNNST